MTTALVTDSRMERHDTGISHPERPARLSHTISYLENQKWFSDLLLVPSQKCDIDQILLVHELELIERAKKTCDNGLPYLDTPDVAVCKESFDVACLATGSVLSLANAVVTGKATNGFAHIRPPGHHAEKNIALGFCIFNSIAICARYLQLHHGIEKILILDWDVHHGNGTQHIFEEDSSIVYISIHQYPHYPGTGAHSESGHGSGKGATLNCPMASGSSDIDYIQAFKEKILPAIDSFRPELILISAGFDAHTNDPLGSINLSTEFYAWMTQVLMESANNYCDNRIISILEGGYDLDALASSVSAHLKTLKQI